MIVKFLYVKVLLFYSLEKKLRAYHTARILLLPYKKVDKHRKLK